MPAIRAGAPSTIDEKLPVKIAAPDLCGRFSGRVIRGVNAKAKTPQWMVERLERCGQRSVSALVDISNYVMLEFGRPSHVFDLDKIHGGLDVRWGRKGEPLKLLNGNTVEVDERVGVIADDERDRIAGRHHGRRRHGRVRSTRRNIYLEAAFWWPEAIQGRSRRFNFSTDAGHRFERGVDPRRRSSTSSASRADRRHLRQAKRSARSTTRSSNLPEREPVHAARRARRQGDRHAGRRDEMRRRHLHAPGPAVRRASGGAFAVTPPSYRFDIEIEEDLIEEVARVLRLREHPGAPAAGADAMLHRAGETRARCSRVRHAAGRLGYQETINFSFVEAAWEARLRRQRRPDQAAEPDRQPDERDALVADRQPGRQCCATTSTARRTACACSKSAACSCATRRGQTAAGRRRLRPAEAGRGLAYGPALDEQWGAADRARSTSSTSRATSKRCSRRARCASCKAEHPALHPGRCAASSSTARSSAVIGELHPRWRQKYDLPQAPVLFEVDARGVAAALVPVPREISKFPRCERDLALVVDQKVAVRQLLDELETTRFEPVCRHVVRRCAVRSNFAEIRHFRWSGSARKSLAFRLLARYCETLQDDAVEAAHGETLAEIAAASSA